MKQIVQSVFPGNRLIRTWPLEGGISAGMTAIELQEPGGPPKTVILRAHSDGQIRDGSGKAADEFRLLRFLHNLGVAAPRPYYLDTSGAVLSRPYMVIEYIDGRMDLAPADVDAYLRILAGQLVKIHGIDGCNPGLAFLRSSKKGCAQMRRGRSAEADQSLDEERIRIAVEKYKPKSGGNPPALLHGDYWPGNTLWCKGELVGVIDWEDATVGDPLFDLANSRMEVAWILGIDALRLFTDHYRSLMSLEYRNLPYWDLCAALRFIRLARGDLAGLAAYFAPYGRDDITEETIRANYAAFVNQAFKRLVIS